MSRILAAFGMDDEGESQAQGQKILNALDPGHPMLSSEAAHATQSVERSATAATMPPDPALPREFLPMDSDPVCVPATPARMADEEPFVLETHEIAGEQCLLVFTTPHLLVEELGRYQPFLVMYMDAAAQVAVAGGVERVYVDPILPAALPRWSESSYRELLADVQRFAQTKKGEDR